MQVPFGESSPETDSYHRWMREIEVWRAPTAVRVIGSIAGREVVVRSGPDPDPQVYSVALSGPAIDPFVPSTWAGVPYSQVRDRLDPAPARFYRSLAAWWDSQTDTLPKLS